MTLQSVELLLLSKAHASAVLLTRMHVQVGAIRGSTKREPTVVGKPQGFMLKNIADRFNLKPDQICMVGDRLDTDIMFGQNGGLTTALVLSGVTTEEMLLSPENKVHPDVYMAKLPELLIVKDKL
jgi:phosphoglycolate phosphatase